MAGKRINEQDKSKVKDKNLLETKKTKSVKPTKTLTEESKDDS